MLTEVFVHVWVPLGWLSIDLELNVFHFGALYVHLHFDGEFVAFMLEIERYGEDLSEALGLPALLGLPIYFEEDHAAFQAMLERKNLASAFEEHIDVNAHRVGAVVLLYSRLANLRHLTLIIELGQILKICLFNGKSVRSGTFPAKSKSCTTEGIHFERNGILFQETWSPSSIERQ